MTTWINVNDIIEQLDNRRDGSNIPLLLILVHEPYKVQVISIFPRSTPVPVLCPFLISFYSFFPPESIHYWLKVLSGLEDQR